MGGILRAIGSFFLDIIETIVVALAIFVVIYLFLFQPHQVKGASMEANFHDNEYILTDKVSYKFSQPKRGDVVIFKAPRNPDLDFIKRVIGLPGERIKVQGGHVYINDQLLKEEYLPSALLTQAGAFLTEGKELVIPPDNYIVLGDNRNHSSDSREWGPITPQEIIGKAFFRYWPPQKIGITAHVSY